VAETPAKRKAGHPVGKVSTLTPGDLLEIERMYLQGVSASIIAERFGVSHPTILHQINKKIRPLWQERMVHIAEEEHAKVDLLYQIAWERFQESKKPGETVHIEMEAVKAGADPQVVKRALTRVGKTGEVCWLQVIEWCLDWKAKVNDSYAALRHKHEHAGGITAEIRVAGTTPQEFTRTLLEEIMQGIAEMEQTPQPQKRIASNVTED
jgi:hypothetical protein